MGCLPVDSAKRAFESELTVSFEDTNVVGNVYFANYLRWRGKVREQFLCEKAPEILDEMRAGLELVTLAVDCRFQSSLFALDRVLIRMRLVTLTAKSARMSFDYYRATPAGEELVAYGSQEIGACRLIGGRRQSVELPQALATALADYA
ncbi:MAG TPA: acyl-CoA thioesterase [Verrucomicrobiota bacterium]|nr:acyl-CoA thioesterase [Verrucomicrobiota bacterium]